MSRVIQGLPSVASDKVVRVQNAIGELNYTPLRKRSPNGAHPLCGKEIVVLLVGMERSMANSPFVAATIHGAESALSVAGAYTMVADVPAADHVPPILQRRSVDGIIAKGAMQCNLVQAIHPRLMDRLEKLPCIWISGRPDGMPGDSIRADDLAIGRMVASYLHNKGHRRLAYLNPKSDHVLCRDRQLGFQLQATQFGATVQNFLGNPSDWKLPLQPIHGRDAVRGLMDQLLATRPRPTAVFVPTDGIAVAVYGDMAARNLQVGKDLSVISSNNETILISNLNPALTTTNTHADQIGRRAVDMLPWRMQDRSAAIMNMHIEPILVEGKSVMAVNDARVTSIKKIQRVNEDCSLVNS